MKKIILLALVCTGFVVTTPFMAHALDSEKISQNLDSHSESLRQREANMSLAEPRGTTIAQYRNQNRQRQFSVYYRSPRDRQWTFEGYHANRNDAQRAANRLERRGYRTYIQVSRRVNSGMNRG
jgi:outer membrane lipoprotein-sorting protein